MGLDEGLAELGRIGWYQIKCYILLIGALSFSAYFSMSFVFTAANLDYRCFIPECEQVGGPYKAPWLRRAVPFTNNKPTPCLRYLPDPDSNSTDACSSFLQDQVVDCDNFVFSSQHTSIQTSFDLYCSDNQWKLSFVGTLNNIGQFIGMPLIGFVSDRFGRKTMLVGCLILSSIVGTIKSFAPSYYSFLFLDMLDAIVGDGIYPGGIIIGAEYAGPDKRTLAIAILSSSYSLGEMIMGFAAWFILDWRNLLRILYVPGLLFISYIWLLPESMRWLAARGRKEEALELFERMEKTNNTYISAETRKTLFSEANQNGDIKLETEEKKEASVIKEMFKSCDMLTRVIFCSFIWVTHTIVFYGLNMNSLSIAGNRYINFILVSLAEVPGYMLAAVLMNFGGRRITLSSCLLISATSCLLFHFLPPGYSFLSNCIYFVGKMGITASFTILYTFTTEMFPTNLRASLLGVCSMFGRIGSMIAPQTPLMAKYLDPLLIFAGMAYASGLLVFYFPETANAKLPDNIKEAQRIGDVEKPYPVPQ